MKINYRVFIHSCVSVKNEVNIMMKNIVDVVLGGQALKYFKFLDFLWILNKFSFTYWVFGYGMSYGRGALSNPFIALGDFFIDPGVEDPLMGEFLINLIFKAVNYFYKKNQVKYSRPFSFNCPSLQRLPQL